MGRECLDAQTFEGAQGRYEAFQHWKCPVRCSTEISLKGVRAWSEIEVVHNPFVKLEGAPLRSPAQAEADELEEPERPGGSPEPSRSREAESLDGSRRPDRSPRQRTQPSETPLQPTVRPPGLPRIGEEVAEQPRCQELPDLDNQVGASQPEVAVSSPVVTGAGSAGDNLGLVIRLEIKVKLHR